MYFDPELVVTNKEETRAAGAVAPWANTSSPYYRQTLTSLARHLGIDMKTPFGELPEAAQQAILHGTGDESVTMEYDDGLRTYKTIRPFEGVLPTMQRRCREPASAWLRQATGTSLTGHPRPNPGGPP